MWLPKHKRAEGAYTSLIRVKVQKEAAARKRTLKHEHMHFCPPNLTTDFGQTLNSDLVNP